MKCHYCYSFVYYSCLYMNYFGFLCHFFVLVILKLLTTIYVFMKSLSIILPLWNESQALPRLFSKIQKFKDKTSLKLEIILINDGSTDTTKQLIYKFKDNFNGKCKIISYNSKFIFYCF